jgi:hypothetical protein
MKMIKMILGSLLFAVTIIGSTFGIMFLSYHPTQFLTGLPVLGVLIGITVALLLAVLSLDLITGEI